MVQFEKHTSRKISLSEWKYWIEFVVYYILHIWYLLWHTEFYSYRIEHMLSDNNLQICMEKKYIILKNKIIAAVDMHRRAIESVCYKFQNHLLHILLILTRFRNNYCNFFYLDIILFAYMFKNCLKSISDNNYKNF